MELEEAKNAVHIEEQEKNPILLLLSNLKLPFPLKKKNGGSSGATSLEQGAGSSQTERPTMAEVGNESDKPAIVTFPRQSFTSLKLEVETEVSDRSTNPLFLWQVYAIGGFYVLRWAWMRWNEGKGQKKSDNNPPPAND
ncbi:voltage-dependent L-type calcium channel subunit beta-4 [Striga asiatica]|uniref:Voltage-dependent L-type calcium channel subunit beta-4 n=1 Tax=Striga asiatica TaxID=4170 RepID=A0A5A7R0J6_STRAF|nr:voltage-dependent L-type calcium channel subunit beta-4 [Striga asiatica]